MRNFACLLAVGCPSVAVARQRFLGGFASHAEGFTASDGYLQRIGAAPEDVATNASADVSVPDTEEMESGDGEGQRHVVLARYDEDVAWLKQLPASYNVTIYQSRDPNGNNFVENYGNEASKYLSYIVDNYDSLPESTMFLQAGRMDWHDPIAKDVLLQSWDWDAVESTGGMRSLPTAAPCLVEDSQEDANAARRRWEIPPGCPSIKEHYPKQMATLEEVWQDTFRDELGPLPERWLTHCCAQFQVSRDAIRMHSKDFYETLLHWTLDQDRALFNNDNGARRNHDPDRHDAGHLMEVSWVLLFDQDMATKLPACKGSCPSQGTPRR